MADYLIHQLPNGTPVGVFSRGAQFYAPGNESMERRGIEIVRENRTSAVSWADWVDHIGGRTPHGIDRWSIYPHRDAALEVVLRDAKQSTVWTGPGQ